MPMACGAGRAATLPIGTACPGPEWRPSFAPAARRAGRSHPRCRDRGASRSGSRTVIRGRVDRANGERTGKPSRRRPRGSVRGARPRESGSARAGAGRRRRAADDHGRRPDPRRREGNAASGTTSTAMVWCASAARRGHLASVAAVRSVGRKAGRRPTHRRSRWRRLTSPTGSAGRVLRVSLYGQADGATNVAARAPRGSREAVVVLPDGDVPRETHRPRAGPEPPAARRAGTGDRLLALRAGGCDRGRQRSKRRSGPASHRSVRGARHAAGLSGAARSRRRTDLQPRQRRVGGQRHVSRGTAPPSRGAPVGVEWRPRDRAASPRQVGGKNPA
jgi:hypothetical protein